MANGDDAGVELVVVVDGVVAPPVVVGVEQQA
jgi:hypothetical protein